VVIHPITQTMSDKDIEKPYHRVFCKHCNWQYKTKLRRDANKHRKHHDEVTRHTAVKEVVSNNE